MAVSLSDSARNSAVCCRCCGGVLLSLGHSLSAKEKKLTHSVTPCTRTSYHLLAQVRPARCWQLLRQQHTSRCVRACMPCRNWECPMIVRNRQWRTTNSLFARLISHQPAVLFSQNEPATSNQPQPASSTLLSEQTSTSHQPPANRTGCGTNDNLD
jgi:hypothetical protein